MIAFGFNIDFIDQPLLQDQKFDSALETIKVATIDNSIQQRELNMVSDWQDMSGRKARFRAAEDFSLATQSGCVWAMEVAQVLSLYWTIGGEQIYYQAESLFTAERLQFWLCHTVLPLKFALEKRYEMLHVGAVEVAGRPVFFSAESFGGKSTLTDYFIQQGHALYSDDSLAIYAEDNTFYAIASYPFHRPYRESEVLGYQVDNIARQAKPLYAGYLLEKAAADASINIEELKGVEKYKAFHFSGFIDLDFFKAQHFLLRCALAEAIPMYKVTIPWSLARLPEVYSHIVMHSTVPR